jgi:hypothetical protein
VRLARGPVVVVIRAGPHGPDHQLGHAHADLLSFELSRGRERLVVDTGTGTYAAGPERQRLRSTAAHNTLQLDGEELLEAWSAFRTGRRGRARSRARGELPGWTWIHAWHDGWTWLPGAPVHHRLLAVGDDAVLVVDAVLGSGRHRIASRLHVHPDAPAGALRVHALRGSLASGPAPLHERFGETREMTELVVGAEADLPWAGGFWLRPGGPDGGGTRGDVTLEGPFVTALVEEGSRVLRLRWDLGRTDPGAVSFEPG